MRELKVEYIPIESITPYKHNAKIHTDEQIKQIVKSIKEFGFNDPIAIDENNIVIEGHGRLLAAKELKMTEVPTIKIKGLTDQQKKAYILAHNQLTMNTGFDLDILSDELDRITEFNMEDFGFELDLGDEDVDPKDVVEVEVPKAPVIPKSKLGDIYQLGEHRLMCGDSTKIEDVTKLMNGQIADLLFTDPPYNNDADLQENSGGTIMNNSMSHEDFIAFLNNAFSCAYEHLNLGRSFYVWCSSIEISTFIECLKTSGLPMHQLLIWVKNQIGMTHADYKWKHEPCIYGWKPGASHYFINEYNNPTVIEDQLDISKLKKEEMQRLLEEIFSDKVKTTIIHEHRSRNTLHPTMKPLKMCADLIHNSTRPKELVLDLFGGSGSTMIACEQISRRCFTMEYDPKYVDVIIKRWEDFTGQKAIKLN